MSWFEPKHPVSNKAPKHFEVALKKSVEKEFTNQTTISPKFVKLQLSIDDRDFIKFVEIAKKFSDEHNCDMKISTDGTDTHIEIGKNKLIEFMMELGKDKNKGFELDEGEVAHVNQLMEN